jgi:acetyl-CoA acetyltransferase
MLEEIHLADSVRTPFGSFCGALADVSAVEFGKAPVKRSGVKQQDVKELFVRNRRAQQPPNITSKIR